MAPFTVPIPGAVVQVKLLGALEIKFILGLVPLQILNVFGFVTTGTGSTVTVIVLTVPAHKPVVEVGITLY